MSNKGGQTSPPLVVAVEDNPADARLVEEGVEAVGVEVDLEVIHSGGQALDRLEPLDPDTPAARPGLVLLDLNLPGASGFDVLRAIRTEAALQNVPIVVVSSSESENDIRRVYELAANAYVVKPVDPDEYIQMVESAVDFWILNATQEPTHD